MSQNRLSATANEEMVMAQTANEKKAGGNGAAKNSPSRNGVNGPSPNGANGPVPSGREPDGRFAKGNSGGPGNPFARRVAALRQAALESVTPDDMRAIMAMLTALARDGDVAAAKVVLVLRHWQAG